MAAAEPLVTVIIPTYKRAVLLPRVIQNVGRQTYRSIEILVVDDGSPDDTASVVRMISDPRVRYVRHETNKGLPAARNTGIREARGEYIAFIDDDDEWREDKLEKQLNLLTEYDAVLCMGVSKGYPMRVHRRPCITLDDLRRGSFNPSSLVAKAAVLRSVWFDESLRQGEDWDAFIRIAQRYSIGWLGEPLLLYNEEGPGRMTDEKKYLSGPELEKRVAILYKHRHFFGPRWFNYHLADSLFSHIASRRSKAPLIAYAIRRCGVRAVSAALGHRVRRRIRRVAWRHGGFLMQVTGTPGAGAGNRIRPTTNASRNPNGDAV